MKRESFIFYQSFSDAIAELDDACRLAVYDAIVQYGLTGEMPEVSGVPKAIMTLIRPQIDANLRRYENGRKGAEHGKKGGRPRKNTGEPNPTETPESKNENPEETPKKPQENPEITPEKGQANPTETPNVNVNDNVNDNDNKTSSIDDGKKYSSGKPQKKETKKGASPQPPSMTDLSFCAPGFVPVVEKWLEYKKSRREGYKSPESLKAMYEKLFKLSGGAPSVAWEIVNESMANNYAGLFALKNGFSGTSPATPTPGRYGAALVAMNGAKERIRQRNQNDSNNGSNRQ